MITYGPHETLPKPPASALEERSIVERMADTMREMAFNGIAVTAETLAEHSGFTRAEIAAHGLDAADLAKANAVRQVA